MSRGIVLTGFMGTGKTAAGRVLAGMLGYGFVDTDAEIERRAGLGVAAIFARHGEPRFRRLEAELCRELASRNELVIATGGGTLLPPENLAAFTGSGWTVALLEAAPDVILSRLGDDGERPLLGPGGDGSPASRRAELERLLSERTAAYQRIPWRLDTGPLSPRQVAARLAARASPAVRAIDLELPPGMMRPFGGGGGGAAGALPGTSRIEVGRGALSTLGPRLRELGPPSLVLLLVARPLRALLLDQLVASCEDAGLPWREVPVDDAEASKRLPQVLDLLEAITALEADREAVVVAAGGGVTGDLAGFVAALYMRGLPLVQVPTTLLAQADASIGAKVGVNHRRAKNLIGTFHAPHLVLADPCVLRTLPPRQLANGMAEVVKTALIGSAPLFEFLAGELASPALPAPAAIQRGPAFLERCVVDSARVKARIVAADPCEAGERRLLNLGHTLGHALETAGGYGRLLHGEAVGLGTLAALRIAVRRGAAEEELLARTRRLLERCGLPTALPAALAAGEDAALLDALRLDKKRGAGGMRFVLPQRPGLATVVQDVTVKELLEAADWLRQRPAPRVVEAGKEAR